MTLLFALPFCSSHVLKNSNKNALFRTIIRYIILLLTLKSTFHFTACKFLSYHWSIKPLRSLQFSLCSVFIITYPQLRSFGFQTCCPPCSFANNTGIFHHRTFELFESSGIIFLEVYSWWTHRIVLDLPVINFPSADNFNNSDINNHKCPWNVNSSFPSTFNILIFLHEIKHLWIP